MRVRASVLAEPVRQITADPDAVTIRVSDDTNPESWVAITLTRADIEALSDRLAAPLPEPHSLSNRKTPVPDITIHFDGSCEPNPGGVATYGWVVSFAGPGFAADVTGWGVAAEGAAATNNVAEYAALGHALKWLHERGGAFPPGPIAPGAVLAVRGDSQLVVNQLTGVWACRNKNLGRYLVRCKELLFELAKEWRAEWVPREQNHRADALARDAYEQHTGKPYPEHFERNRT